MYDIIENHTESPYYAAALRRAGAVLYGLGKYDKAYDLFGIFVKKSPQNPFAGEVFTCLIDCSLERRLDIKRARTYADAAQKWAEAHSAENMPDHDIHAPPWGVNFRLPGRDTINSFLHSIYIRCGVIAYLQQDYDQAADYFHLAQPYRRKRGFVVVSGHIPTCLEKVVEAAEARKKLTPHDVMTGNRNIQLVLQYADILAEAGLGAKAISLYDEVIGARQDRVTPEQKSWAHFQKAQTVYKKPACLESRADYLAARRECPHAPWAPKALFYAGTITNNFEQDLRKANVYFRQVLEHYPKSKSAIRCGFYVGVSHQQNGEWVKAATAYRRFLKMFPDSMWADPVADRLKDVTKKIKKRERQ